MFRDGVQAGKNGVITRCKYRLNFNKIARLETKESEIVIVRSKRFVTTGILSLLAFENVEKRRDERSWHGLILD